MTERPGTSIDCDRAAALLGPLTQIVAQAGAAILSIDRGSMMRREKSDASPVTEADLAADRVIAEGLARLLPEVQAVSEERSHLARLPYTKSFFLIDPLDGTKEFIAGRSEFTVNLALVTGGTPLLGIVGAPALGLIWRGLGGRGAERLKLEGGRIAPPQPIRTAPAPRPGEPWRAMVSRSHRDSRSAALIERLPGAVSQLAG